jgi:hypothetical protein
VICTVKPLAVAVVLPNVGVNAAPTTDVVVVVADGTVVVADGTVVVADGTVVVADGTVVVADGTVVVAGAHGSVT